MRQAFANEITRLAAERPDIVLLSGDIGNRMFDQLKAVAPGRFYNCGVAEANMTGVAAGLAARGLKPFTYTITPFVTTRCLEQIRVDVCYHNMPVTIVAVGAGYAYAELGATHHACEDIAFLRALPGMTVVCPGDAHEVTAAIRAAADFPGPLYIRMGKKGEPRVHAAVPEAFQIGKALVLREGCDVALLSTGNMLPDVMETAEQLDQQGIAPTVVSFHTVKPLDTAFLTRVFATHRVVATVEEHSLLGGFGAAVAEWKADQDHAAARLLRFGTPDVFPHGALDHTDLRTCSGLTPPMIGTRILQALS